MTHLNRYTCEEAFRRLDDYLDRELSSEETALVHEHLEICAGCAREFNFEASVLARRAGEAPADRRAGVAAGADSRRADGRNVRRSRRASDSVEARTALAAPRHPTPRARIARAARPATTRWRPQRVHVDRRRVAEPQPIEAARGIESDARGQASSSTTACRVKSAPATRTPLRFASVRSAPTRMAPSRFAPVSTAPTSDA